MLSEQDMDKDTGIVEEVKFKCKTKIEDDISETKDEIKFEVTKENVVKVRMFITQQHLLSLAL